MSHPQGHKGYEPTDAKAKPLIIFTIVLALFTAGSFAAGLLIYKALEMGQAMMDPGVHPMAVKSSLPAGVPKLQIHEAADLLQHHKEQAEKADAYSWIDRDQKVVRVPVDKAIDLVLKNGELKSRE
jgi:hypothetical protein